MARSDNKGLFIMCTARNVVLHGENGRTNQVSESWLRWWAS